MTFRASRTRGFSLFEIVIAAALASMLLTLVIWFLVPSLNASWRGTNRINMERMAVGALGRLAADIQTTTAAGLSAFPGSSKSVCAIDPILTVTDDALQVWDKRLVVWVLVPDSDLERSRLVRKEFPSRVTPPALTLPFTSTAPYQCASYDELLQVSASRDDAAQVMATMVESFAVEKVDQGSIADLVKLTVRLQSRRGTDVRETEMFELTRLVAMKQRI